MKFRNIKVAKIIGTKTLAGLLSVGLAMSAPVAAFAEDGNVAVEQAAAGMQAKAVEESACIRCARCVHVCPIGLHPYLIRIDLDKHDTESAKQHGLMDCVLCSACSFICPARRYLSSSFKTAREDLAAKARR